MSQIALPLGWPTDPRDDSFLVTAANAQSVRLLDHWQAWPVMAAVLTGPRRSGRSLLARRFAARSGGVVIDDAERVQEAELFHAWNRAQAAARPLLIVAGALPPVWPVQLPDLRSRLAASPLAAIGPPDDELVPALLAQLFDRHGLDARPDLIDWLSARVERSYMGIEQAVETLNRAVLENRKRLSIPMARASLVDAGLLPSASPEAS